MPRKRGRWTSKTLRAVLPLKDERQIRPRFDGAYESADRRHVRFRADGSAEFAGELGVWEVARGSLLVTTPGWQCEGAVDVLAVYLLCSPQGRVSERAQLEMHFTADAVSKS